MFGALTLASLLVLGGAAQQAAAEEPGTGGEGWSGAVALYVFGPPGEDAYAQPVASADRGALHLEARYNYEDRGAGSLFAGWNVAFGEAVIVQLTPMLGAVFGSVDGIVPSLAAGVDWKGLAFYVESEYVIDPADSDNNFLYAWSELTYSPVDWLRFGVVSQRTRVFEQELTIDRGLLVGAGSDRFWFDVYFFNPDADDPYAGASLTLTF